ncbi:hypothetical protein JKP88DRAFT_268428 [Tribonema minus]|uniref:tRNA(Ile)-lysidine synthetase n=1 Tax=Tribonema minus TaxID=303371 RepID=A0A835Z1B5_9STRA|nr:hypothetical protein JKP88DRAFT_268428 [Tribonema minus]
MQLLTHGASLAVFLIAWTSVPPSGALLPTGSAPWRGAASLQLRVSGTHTQPVCVSCSVSSSGPAPDDASGSALEQQTWEALTERCGVRPGDTILVLCSGGADSTALLHIMAAIRHKTSPSLELATATFDHCLRPEAKEEVEFVQIQARALGISCYTRRWSEHPSWLGKDAKGQENHSVEAAEAVLPAWCLPCAAALILHVLRASVTHACNGCLRAVGIQQRARAWRLAEAAALLAELSSHTTVTAPAEDGLASSSFVATAHHQGDQEETLLLKLARGAHVTRLRGMAWSSALSVEDGASQHRSGAGARGGDGGADALPCSVVRPLLGARKAQLEEYLRRRGVQWLEDPSNATAKRIAGGEAALAARLTELERQSALVADMVRAAAEAWEAQHLPSAGARGVAPPDANALWGPGDFPLPPWADAALPALVQEELLHRFVARGGPARAALAPGLPPRVPGVTLGGAQTAHLAAMARAAGSARWHVDVGGGAAVMRDGDVLRLAHAMGAAAAAAAGATAGGGLGGAGVGEGERTAGCVAGEVTVDEAEARCTITAPPDWEVTATRIGVAEAAGIAAAARDGTSGADRPPAAAAAAASDMVLYNVPPGAVLRVRRRRDGDRFRPRWRATPAKVKDFLRGQGVPLHRRDDVALVQLSPPPPLPLDGAAGGAHGAGAAYGADSACDDGAADGAADAGAAAAAEVVGVYPGHASGAVCEDVTGWPPLLLRVRGRDTGLVYEVRPPPARRRSDNSDA